MTRAPGVMGEARFSGESFSAPAARCRRFSGWILGRLGARQRVRVLDIGCGNGAQIFDLAGALPDAEFTGVDLSVPNIDFATRQVRERGLEKRTRFVACDYLDFRAEVPFDLIISYSTLQLIPGDSVHLFRKIAGELSEGGLFMNVVPYECPYNRVLLRVRSVFAALRSRQLDALVLFAARKMHGARFDDVMLRERVGYMYQQLERLDSPALRQMLERQCSLEFVDEIPEVHASLAQAKHKLTVFRKRAPKE